jgi:hypothetical protein
LGDEIALKNGTRQTVFKAVCRVFLFPLYLRGMALKTERKSHALELPQTRFYPRFNRQKKIKNFSALALPKSRFQTK